MSNAISVLVVDDSTLARRFASDIIKKDPTLILAGTAGNGVSAIIKNNELNPDVIILDIEMPVLDGLSCLKTIMETNPKPVIMLSSLTQHGSEATFKSLELGAIDFIPKPSSNTQNEEIAKMIVEKIKSAAGITVKRREKTDENVILNTMPWSNFKGFPPTINKRATLFLTIGISTGGPAALNTIFREFPENFPAAVLVVQHMAEGFTKEFAKHLDKNSKLSVKEAEDGDIPSNGCIYIAPGNRHMTLQAEVGGYTLRINNKDKVSGHRPSIDVLFQSVAKAAAPNIVAVLMTGMGKDGANGMKGIYDAGGYTIAQDQTSSIVYGMNRTAIEMNVVKEIVPLEKITKKIVEYIQGISNYAT